MGSQVELKIRVTTVTNDDTVVTVVMITNLIWNLWTFLLTFTRHLRIPGLQPKAAVTDLINVIFLTSSPEAINLNWLNLNVLKLIKTNNDIQSLLGDL